jgi:TRAP-type C4-dicarboxylate transport system permease small subunit
MKRLNDILEALAGALVAVSSVLFMIALCLMLFDVILRYGFSSSITGSHEFIALAFSYAFFLGTAALYIRRGDVVLGFALDRAPMPLKKLFNFIVQACIFVTMSAVAYQAVVLALSWHGMKSPALGYPQSFALAPVFICSAFIAVSAVAHMSLRPKNAIEPSIN